MSDNDTKWIAETNRSYGTGESMYDAIRKMVDYWHGSDLDASTYNDVTLAVWEASGYSGGQMFQIDADEVHHEAFYKINPVVFQHFLNDVQDTDANDYEGLRGDDFIARVNQLIYEESEQVDHA